MAEHSKIEWTDATFNPWIGCEKISPACDHCYAEALSRRMKDGAELWSGVRRKTGFAYWRGPQKWARRLPAELGRRPRVFCASLADVFDNVVPTDWRSELFTLIERTPELDWLLLTKRIGNAPRMLPTNWGSGYPNVWLGATVANQDELARDAPKLLAVPARVRFLSIEPMLGPVDLKPVPGVDWIIVGGESGPGARPLNLAWARDVVHQCEDAGVACFVKQLGARPFEVNPNDSSHIRSFAPAHPKGGDIQEFPREFRVRQFPSINVSRSS